jgi:hypothetical protein
MQLHTPSRFLLFACGAIWISSAASIAAARDADPCEIRSSESHEASEAARHTAAAGLAADEFGLIVYDSNQDLCWLADANLAGHPEVRAAITLSIANPDGSTPLINPDGTMDWQTALNWVNALNSYNHGKGWLNHKNWQLPTNPTTDLTCSAFNTNNFGAQCTGSALGNLYNVGLRETYPNSVVPRLFSFVWPFINLQPGLYWAADANSSGEETFSFNTGSHGSNTTKYNFFHVLPMTNTVLGPIPPGSGVLPYLRGPAAGRAVYDTLTGISWTLDANLPAFDNFSVTATTTIIADMNGNTNGGTVTVPLVDKDGSVYLSAAAPVRACSASVNTSGLTSEWITAMNANSYAGTSDWELPCLSDLQALYSHINIKAGDTRLEWPFGVDPFWRLQPGFYWACARSAATPVSNGLCDYGMSAAEGLEWSFNFDDGFEGTDLPNKQFYVMVYFPAD